MPYRFPPEHWAREADRSLARSRARRAVPESAGRQYLAMSLIAAICITVAVALTVIGALR